MRFYSLRLILLLLLAISGVGSAASQTIDEIRASLRQSFHDGQVAGSLAGLIVLSDEFELSGADYWIDNPEQTRLTSLALPYRTTFRPWDTPWPGIYFEGVLGYAHTKESVADVYGGGAPGLETSIDARFTTYSGLVGLGPQFQLCDDLTLALIVNGGGAWLESDARYGGPGAALTSQLLDGLVFNWDGYTVSGGGALRLDWVKPLGDKCQLEVAARYDLRWTKTIDAEDAALEFTSRAQFFTLRTDVVGPTGMEILDHPLTWRSTAGCRAFIEGDMYDITAMGLVGGALELDTDGNIPLGPKVSLSAGFIFGNRVLGYTLGLGVEF